MPMILNPYRFAASGTPATNLVAAVGGFNAPATGTAGTTVSVTGLSFQPVFVFLWMTGRTETSDAAALSTALSGRASFGMFSATEQYSWGSAHIDAQATQSLTGGIHRTNAVMVQAGGNSDYRTLVFTSMNSDGFTVQVGTNGANPWAACRIQYLALGGTDLAHTKIGTVTPASGTGNEAFTPLSFQPGVLLFPNFTAALSSFAAGAWDALGCATGSSNMWLWSGQSITAQHPEKAKRYFRSDECGGLSGTDGATMSTRTRLVSLDGSGFTVNKLDSSGAGWTQPYAALAGVNVQAGTFTASSGGGSVTGLGFTPKAILFMTHGTTQSTADTVQAEFVYSIGASVTGITQRCAHVHDIDNLNTSDIVTAHRDDGVIITSSTGGAIDSRISVSSHDSDGFTYTMPTSTNSGYIVGYLALG